MTTVATSLGSSIFSCSTSQLVLLSSINSPQPPNLLKCLLHVVIDVVSDADDLHYLSVEMIVGDYPAQLGEVPREPLFKSHAESVNILIHLLNQGDSLHDGLVLSVDVSGALGTRECVSKTQLGLGYVLLLGLYYIRVIFIYCLLLNILVKCTLIPLNSSSIASLKEAVNPVSLNILHSFININH